MWTLNKKTKKILNAAGKEFGDFYSGQPTASSPTGYELDESLVNKGPIPSGIWQMITVIFNHPKCGPDCIRLAPQGDDFVKKISSYERSPYSFLIHGDNATHTASDGCVIETNNCRRQMWDSGERLIRVIDG